MFPKFKRFVVMQNSFTRFFMSLLVILGNLQPVSAMIVPRLNSAPKRSNFSKKDCKALIKQLEQEYAIPEGLLAAIGAVESEHTPYAVNCNGKARMFTSHDAAKAYVRELRKQGIIDINIGVLQINYAYHQKRFKAEDLLNPYNNVPYAAKYLASLQRLHGSWTKAVKLYHSPVAKYQNMYFAKVMGRLKRTNLESYQMVSGVKALSPARSTNKSAA